MILTMLKSNINWVSMSDTAIIIEICKNLKQLRLKKNMTQKQLAEKSGLDPATISRTESGRAATLLTLVQVLRALDNLEILDTFVQETEVSPIQQLKLQQKIRKRASPFVSSEQKKRRLADLLDDDLKKDKKLIDTMRTSLVAEPHGKKRRLVDLLTDTNSTKKANRRK